MALKPCNPIVDKFFVILQVAHSGTLVLPWNRGKTGRKKKRIEPLQNGGGLWAAASTSIDPLVLAGNHCLPRTGGTGLNLALRTRWTDLHHSKASKAVCRSWMLVGPSPLGSSGQEADGLQGGDRRDARVGGKGSDTGGHVGQGARRFYERPGRTRHGAGHTMLGWFWFGLVKRFVVCGSYHIAHFTSV